MFVKFTFLKYLKGVMPYCLGGGKVGSGKEQGFTLIEVLVAVVIMGLSYVAILQSFSLSTRNILKVEEVRANMMRYGLEFDQEYLESRIQGEESAAEQEGEVFLEGSRYELLMVSDESNTFQTLRLEKL